MNYPKGDYRASRPGDVMTVGPLLYIDEGPQPYRHERRTIGARYRSVYGRAEYEAMRARIRAEGGRTIAGEMIMRFMADARKAGVTTP